MATLVSPGVSVTVTDESFFIPVSAPTVPIFFIATADEKKQADGSTDAQGTFEYDVVRTVTSLSQSTQLYGIPKFLEDSTNSKPFHGDARNEYGLFALNQFLGIGNKAYVVRANVNLADDIDTDIRPLWDTKIAQAKVVLSSLITDFLNVKNSLPVGSPPAAPAPGTYLTVTAAELQQLARTATTELFAAYSFKNVKTDFFGQSTVASNLAIFANGYPPIVASDVYDGFDYVSANIGASPSYPGGGTVSGEFTATEGADFLVAAADDMKYTVEFLDATSLGANDAARRAAIVTALQASILSNTDIRSENFDYNLIICPNYHETADELLSLVVDMQEEALVIADTPMDLSPDGITNPSTGWAGTTKRQRNVSIAYYYPSALASNLDGKNVVCAASGVALRTITYSDDVSFLWFAPAGIRRGIITGITDIGYVSGTLGTATTFVPVALNPGQRNALYQYDASGDINPLVFFPGSGFLVWGQKTSAPAASAMDRVNVSRLMKYIKRQLRRNTLSFVFEPNDQLTRDNLKAVVDAFLGDLIVKRGLYDYVTICDESNNTPDRLDRNELYIDIALKPVKAAEFIYIPIRIVATGASI